MPNDFLREIEAKLSYFIENASDHEFWDAVSRADNNGTYSQMDVRIIDLHKDFIGIGSAPFATPGNEKPDVLRKGIEQLNLWFQMSFGSVQMADSNAAKQSFKFVWGDSAATLVFVKVSDGLEVYSPQDWLVDRTLIIQDRAQTIRLRSRFVADDATPGLKASAFFRIDRPMSFEEVSEISLHLE